MVLDGLNVIGEGLHAVHGDSDPGPVHDLLGKLELLLDKDNAISTIQGQVVAVLPECLFVKIKYFLLQ